MASFQVTSDAISNTSNTITALRVPVVNILPSPDESGRVVFQTNPPIEALEFSDGNTWFPIAIGGSDIPVVTGLENIGTAPLANDLFLGYDISQPTENIAMIENIAPGPNVVFAVLDDT